MEITTINGREFRVLKLLGQDVWSLAASYAVCLLMILYWGSYQVLKRKY